MTSPLPPKAAGGSGEQLPSRGAQVSIKGRRWKERSENRQSTLQASQAQQEKDGKAGGGGRSEHRPYGDEDVGDDGHANLGFWQRLW